MANLSIPNCLHIIMVNPPSQLFSLGTFVAKGKFKQSDCVDVLLMLFGERVEGHGDISFRYPCDWSERQIRYY